MVTYRNEPSIRDVTNWQDFWKWCCVTFGEALTEVIHKKGLTIADVSRSVGCTASNISAVMADRNKMVKSPAIVPKIEAAVGVARGDLLKHLPPGHPAHVYYAAEVAAVAPGKPPPFRLLPAGYCPDLEYAGRADGGDAQFQEPDEDLQPYCLPKLPKGLVVVTVDGDSVSGYGVFDGDDVAVLRTLRKPVSGLVVYHSDEGFVVKQWEDGEAWRKGPGDAERVLVEMTRSTRIFGVVVGIVFGRRTGDLPTAKPPKKPRRK